MNNIINFSNHIKYSFLDEGSIPEEQKSTKEEIYEQIENTSMIEYIKELIEKYQSYNTDDTSVVLNIGISYLINIHTYQMTEKYNYLDNIVKLTIFPYITKKDEINEKLSPLYTYDDVEEIFENSYIVKYDEFIQLLKENNIIVSEEYTNFNGLTSDKQNPIFSIKVLVPTLEKHINL